MSSGSDAFAHSLLRVSMAETLKDIGFQSASDTSLEVMTDITKQCETYCTLQSVSIEHVLHISIYMYIAYRHRDIGRCSQGLRRTVG